MWRWQEFPDGLEKLESLKNLLISNNKVTTPAPPLLTSYKSAPASSMSAPTRPNPRQIHHSTPPLRFCVSASAGADSGLGRGSDRESSCVASQRLPPPPGTPSLSLAPTIPSSSRVRTDAASARYGRCAAERLTRVGGRAALSARREPHQRRPGTPFTAPSFGFACEGVECSRGAVRRGVRGWGRGDKGCCGCGGRADAVGAAQEAGGALQERQVHRHRRLTSPPEPLPLPASHALRRPSPSPSALASTRIPVRPTPLSASPSGPCVAWGSSGRHAVRRRRARSAASPRLHPPSLAKVMRARRGGEAARRPARAWEQATAARGGR